jgi:hypothetical protein
MIVWKIENFTKLKDKKIFGDAFFLGGIKWRLVAYPKGAKGDESLSIYLEVANHELLEENWVCAANFTFSVRNQIDGSSKVTKEGAAHTCRQRK